MFGPARAPNPNSRGDTMWFLLPAVLLGTIGLTTPYPLWERLAPDFSLLLTTATGLLGVSIGMVLSDGMFPDGERGWGRVSALWLGALPYLPAAAFNQGLEGDGRWILTLALFWITFSTVLFTEPFRLNANQARRFSLYFHAFCAVLTVVGTLIPKAAPWIATAMVMGGWFPALWIRASVLARDASRTVPVADANEPDPAPSIPDPDPPHPTPHQEARGDGAPKDGAPKDGAPNDGALDDTLDDDPPWPWVPPQTIDTGALFGRWLVAVAIDYGLILSLLYLAISMRGTTLVIISLSLCVGMYLFYQPIGEGTGGTLGQRLTGIKLIEPGYPQAAPGLIEIGHRQILRIGAFWAVGGAVLYWLSMIGVTPAERARIAQGANGPPYRPWMYIERARRPGRN